MLQIIQKLALANLKARGKILSAVFTGGQTAEE